jgi:hypothetical protein
MVKGGERLLYGSGYAMGRGIVSAQFIFSRLQGID